MKHRSPELPASDQARLEAFLRRARPPDPLSREAVERITHALASSPAPHPGPLRLVRLGLKAALVGPLVAGGLAYHAGLLTRGAFRPAPAPAVEARAQAAAPAPLPPDVTLPRARQPGNEPRGPADPDPAPARPGQRAHVGRTTAGPDHGAGRGGSDFGAQAHLLGLALKQMRQQADPGGALALLRRHESLYPASPLRAEVRAAEVEAYLGLQDRAGALRALDGLSGGDLERLPQRDALGVLRGELLAEAGDCEAALAVFGDELGAALEPPLRERALWGRALCRLRLGERAAGLETLQSYLEQFPTGRFAAQARERLCTGTAPQMSVCP